MTIDKDYAVAPGSMLEDWLDENHMTQSELARRLGCSVKHVNQVVNGVATLSHDFAIDLERVTKVPARLWSNMESNYRADLARLAREANETEARAFLDKVPVATLRKRGFIKTANKAKRNLYVMFEEVLSFFQVGGVEGYLRTYETPCAAYRQSGSHQQDPHALAAWLRLGEIAAQRVDVATYDARKLEEALPDLRDLTRVGALTEAVIRVKHLLAECGVVLLVIEDIPGTRLYGATRWISGQPVVQLSLRRKYDDQFWFTLFHELAHVLKHKRQLFIDYDGLNSPVEEEANKFASDVLIPPAAAADLVRIKSLIDATNFASRVGVAPGVVVGRLQHDGLWEHSKGQGLKRRVNPPLD